MFVKSDERNQSHGWIYLAILDKKEVYRGPTPPSIRELKLKFDNPDFLGTNVNKPDFEVIYEFKRREDLGYGHGV